MTVPAPSTVRQGAGAVLAAVLFVIRGLTGADQHVVNGFGTGATIAVLGAAVLAAGWALWNGRAWGRGLAVFAQLLLLPVAWYMGVGSHQWGYAIPLAVLAAAILVLLFSPATLQWLASPGDQSAASAESSGPETR